MIPTAHPSP